MLVKIECPTNILVIPAINAGPVLAAFEHARCVSTSGWGKEMKIEYHEKGPELSFVPDTYADPATPQLTKALADYEATTQRWLDEYNKRTAAEKKVKELEEKLSKITETVQ